MFVEYEMFGLSIWVWIFIILLNGIIFGAFCSNLADKKGYSSGSWFAGGFFFGIIALIAIAGLPVKWEEFNNLKECPDCREMINIYANVCNSKFTDIYFFFFLINSERVRNFRFVIVLLQ